MSSDDRIEELLAEARAKIAEARARRPGAVTASVAPTKPTSPVPSEIGQLQTLVVTLGEKLEIQAQIIEAKDKVLAARETTIGALNQTIVVKDQAIAALQTLIAVEARA